MPNDSVQIVTRNQLKGYGTSDYQARAITKNLTIFKKEGCENTYKLEDIITSIRIYIQKPRVKVTTRDMLQNLLQILLKRLGNLVDVPFGKGTDPELSKLTRQLLAAMSNTDKVIAELEAAVLSGKGKNK